MPYEIRVMPAHGVAVVTPSGDIDLEEVLATGLALVDHPSWTPGLSVLLDYRRVARFTLDTPDVIQVVHQDRRNRTLLEGCRCAVLASQDLVYGMGRVWSAMSNSSGLEARVFREAEGALAWLGVDAEVLSAP